MQNIAEKGVSLVFRASQGRGLQKFFRGQALDPHVYSLRSHLAPQKQGPGYATDYGLVWALQGPVFSYGLQSNIKIESFFILIQKNFYGIFVLLPV